MRPLNKCPAVSLQNRSATSLLWELLDLFFVDQPLYLFI